GHVTIPPGQFGLLITEEEVITPNDAIAFISVRSHIKFRGLVNVSGFHVDPGYKGKLKFSVYNAGSQTIVLEVGEPAFIIWFADLDRPTKDSYYARKPGHSRITADDVMRIQCE